MEYTLQDDGTLVDAEGNALMVGEEGAKEGVTVTGGQTQAVFDNALQKRLSKNNEKIDTLKAQADRIPALDKMLRELESEKVDLETKLETSRSDAQAEYAEELATARKDADAAKTEASGLREEIKTEAHERKILAACGTKFIRASKDIVPEIAAAAVEVAVHNPDTHEQTGTETRYAFSVKGENGETSEKKLSLDEAVEHMAETNPHYVPATQTSGSAGGGQVTYQNHQNLKRSEMNVEQKAAFTDKHGVDALMALPR